MTDTKTKKTRWSYEGGMATVMFPDKVTQDFDTDLILDTDVREFLFHYGFKQFESDKIAGIGKGATSQDKLAVFDDYFGLLTSGVTKKAVSRTPKITEAQFMAQCKEQGVTEEAAKATWSILNPTK